MHDYAGAWSAERGRCHRFVYGDDDGHPTECPAPPVGSGWRRDGQGRWYTADACAAHAGQDVHLHCFKVYGRELDAIDGPHVRLADFGLRPTERFVYDCGRTKNAGAGELAERAFPDVVTSVEELGLLTGGRYRTRASPIGNWS